MNSFEKGKNIFGSSGFKENAVGKEAENSASAHLDTVIQQLESIKNRVGKEGGAPSPEEFAALLSNIQEARKLAIQEEQNARIDTLTGLPNRRAFNEIMEIEMSRFERTKRNGLTPPLYSLYAVNIDIDFFKNINDSFGHSIGDLYLQKVSAHMRKVLRPTDTLARIGGDEFVVLMPNLDLGNAEQVKDRLLETVREGSAEARMELIRQRPDLALKNSEGNVSASMGFALFNGGETSREFLQRADYASYLAKSAGKDAVVGEDMIADLDPDGRIRKKFLSEKDKK